MNWVSSNCRTLSVLLYPYRFYFLVVWLVGVCLFNLLNYQSHSIIKEVLYIFTIWPFCFWAIIFSWGNSPEKKTTKVQLFMLPYAAGSALLLLALIPLTSWSLFKIYAHTVGS